jgi:hypothetical protein
MAPPLRKFGQSVGAGLTPPDLSGGGLASGADGVEAAARWQLYWP